MKTFLNNMKTRAKKTFTKDNARIAGIQLTSHTLGTAHFVTQMAADGLRLAESRIVHAIDPSISEARVRRVRTMLYCKHRNTVCIAALRAQLKAIELKDQLSDSIDSVKAKLNIDPKVIPLNSQMPLPSPESLNHDAHMLAHAQ